jgi:hypothetical protein
MAKKNVPQVLCFICQKFPCECPKPKKEKTT